MPPSKVFVFLNVYSRDGSDTCTSNYVGSKNNDDWLYDFIINFMVSVPIVSKLMFQLCLDIILLTVNNKCCLVRPRPSVPMVHAGFNLRPPWSVTTLSIWKKISFFVFFSWQMFFFFLLLLLFKICRQIHLDHVI